ncbi:hypothetical protein [Lentzea sp. NPDC055074]
MTYSATNYDTLTGRGPDGKPMTWQVRVVDSSSVPDSALATDKVKTHEGEVLLCRYLPETDDVLGLQRVETLLDNEIRALTRLRTRYGTPVPELPALVGYDFDSAEPFLLLELYRGRRLDNGLSDLMSTERDQFTVGLFRALAQLAAVGLVHGSVGPASLYWDRDTTQLTHLEHSVAHGEAYRSSPPGSESTAHPGDDVQAAGRVVFELYTSRRLGPGEVPDLASQSEYLARLLSGVFAPQPADRPTAEEMLNRLGDRAPLPRPVNVLSLMRTGYERFDLLRPPKTTAPPRAMAAPAPAPVSRPSRRKEIPLAPLAVLLFLVLATAAVLWVIR